MSISAPKAKSADYREGRIFVRLDDDFEISFPVTGNPRLAHGTPAQLSHIEISPYGLHWPDLDEDLSLHGLLAGNYGQHQPHPCAGNATQT